MGERRVDSQRTYIHLAFDNRKAKNRSKAWRSKTVLVLESTVGKRFFTNWSRQYQGGERGLDIVLLSIVRWVPQDREHILRPLWPS